MTESQTAIQVEGVSKSYLIGHHNSTSGQETFRDLATRSIGRFGRLALSTLQGRQIVAGDEIEEFWALKDVSFSVARGEVVGIVGRNGAGKSTLLKVLSRITEPTDGRVTINGRVASLLEVGTGFHPELTGRENVYLNGAILGMSRAEIRRKFDEIIEFAEISKFLDTPVKRYSSGMYVRLAFSVAAHLEPEILIVDEVLAVGDAQFQKKCLGKIGEVSSQGRTVLFVSHHLGSITSLCRSAILLENGRVKAQGPTSEVISQYNRPAKFDELVFEFPERDYQNIRPIRAFCHLRSGQIANAFNSNESISVAINYEGLAGYQDCRLGFRISTPDGQVIFTSASSDEPSRYVLGRGENIITCEIPANLLAPGRYLISFAADIPLKSVLFDEENANSFTVTESGAVGGDVRDGRRGLIRPGLAWRAAASDSFSN